MSIRLRLALWYTAVLATTLLTLGGTLDFVIQARLDEETDATIAAVAGHFASAVLENGTETVLPNVDAFATPGVHVELLDVLGTEISHSAGLGPQELPRDTAAIEQVATGSAAYYTAATPTDRVRVYARPLSGDGQSFTVLVGKSLHDRDAIVSRLNQLLLGGSVFAAVLAFAVGWAIAGRALSPVSDLTAAARTIALSRAFDRRLSARPGKDEVGRLGIAFNEMLASLQTAWETQRRFVDDASHELRAPLTSLRGNLEFLQQATDLPEAERAEVLAEASDEIGRICRLADSLLTLARADAGCAFALEPVELDALLLDAFRLARPLACGQQLSIAHIEQAIVNGDRDRLRQLIMILTDNALKHTSPGGKVAIGLDKFGGTARISVADTGHGIDAADLPHVFDRFWRADQSRARNGGYGLGLSIAKWVAEGHNGRIEVESTPGKGSLFSVFIPLSPDDSKVHLTSVPYNCV